MIHSIRSLAFILAIFVSSHAFAHNKVAVIPLYKSAQTEAAFDAADGSVALTSSDAVIRTVVMNVPSAGTIIANASGYIDLNNDAASHMGCSITKNSTTSDYSANSISGNNNAEVRFVPYGATRGFTVTEAGEVTIRLVCDEYNGTTDISDTNLTVMFFPN